MKLSVKPKLLLCTLILLLLAGCGKELVYLDDILPDTGTSAPDEGSEQEESVSGWLPMPDYDPDAPRAEMLYTHVDYFLETKHCIVFHDIRDDAFVKYINKADGTVHILCGDSLCKHEDCTARHDKIYDGDGSLLYAPEYGRLCWVQCATRTHKTDYPYRKLRWEIVSIDIDNMDFTIHRHYITKPGDKLQLMRYDGGKLYFSRQILRDDGTSEWRLDALSLEDDSVETLGPLAGMYTVRNGVVYYHKTSLQTLNAWDLASGTKATLYEPFGQGQATYWYFNGGFFCYTESDACLRELDPDGNVIREVARTGETDENFHGRWAIAPDGTIYSYTYTYSIETEYPPDNGKIFRWVDGTPEVYVDFGERNCIYTVIALEDRLLVVVQPNNHGCEYYYVIDGVANKVPR